MSDADVTADHVLLIATVGGSPEPLVAALKHWGPARTLFVPSHDTQPAVRQVLELAATEGVVVEPGAYDVEAVADAQDLTACLRALQKLDGPVRGWLARGEGFSVAVDYTGGTKTMSAALALWARRWPCRFSYVGGRERTRNGIGIVVSGSEIPLVTRNPWNALGYQTVEDACAAFDAGDFRAAAEMLSTARNGAGDARVKGEMAALLEVVEAYSAWDRFRHTDAAKRFERLAAGENDLRAVLGESAASRLLREADGHLAHLRDLADPGETTEALVLDLLANAARRAREGRYDDAVARLYRATEALAQIRLRGAFGLATDRMPIDRVPEPLCEHWRSRARDGSVKLGLQDAFALLRALGDPLGERFTALGLDNTRQSPLSARNQSILAHGWNPISERSQRALREKVLALANVSEGNLPMFPRLARPEDR
jgi:CRISPR-associated protein (TIGR02710 family)